MAFIDYIPFDKASPYLQELYSRFGGAKKTPANVVRIAAPNPPVLEAHIEFYRALMSPESPLSGHQREMIAVVVSSINQCHY